MSFPLQVSNANRRTQLVVSAAGTGDDHLIAAEQSLRIKVGNEAFIKCDPEIGHLESIKQFPLGNLESLPCFVSFGERLGTTEQRFCGTGSHGPIVLLTSKDQFARVFAAKRAGSICALIERNVDRHWHVAPRHFSLEGVGVGIERQFPHN